MAQLVANKALNMAEVGELGVLTGLLSDWTSTMHSFTVKSFGGDITIHAEGIFLTEGGKPSSGAISGLTIEDSNSEYTVSGLIGVTLADFIAAINTDGAAAVFATFFQMHDDITGSDDADVLTGFAGEDEIDGRGGDDEISGGDHDDTLVGGAGNDDMDGGAGEDNLDGGNGKDLVNGGEGNDDLRGGAGKDVIDGGDGFDRAYYTDKTDSVVVTLDGANNVKVKVGGVVEDTIRNVEAIHGGEGDDRMISDANESRFYGNGGNDRLTGLAGNDVLMGGDGKDLLKGGTDDDYLAGEDGVDTLLGGAGVDHLVGGAGKDTMTGGSGVDNFWFTADLDAATNVDKITDFKAGEDVLVLSKLVFSAISDAEATAGSFFAIGAAEDADDHIIYDPESGKLFDDADGNGGGDEVLFAQIGKNLFLQASDIVIA